MVHGPVSSGSLLEMQNFRWYPRAIESEFTFEQGLQVTCTHIHIDAWEAVIWEWRIHILGHIVISHLATQ